MCFDRFGGHAPPSARHLFPDSAERSVSLFRFAFRLGQRGIAPLGARPLYEARRQVEVTERHVLHAVGVQQRRRVVAEHRPEGARGRREAERAAGLGVHVRHRERQVGRGQPVEPEAAALGQQLPYLDVVALAGALLVAAPGVAVEQPRLAGPLAEERRDRALVGELGAVVGEHGAEDAARPVGAEDRPDAAQGARDAAGGLRLQQQRELEPAGAVQQREQAGGVLLGTLYRVHLPGRGARVLPEGEERGVRPAGGVAGGGPAGVALARPVADLAPELHVGHAVVARSDPAVDGRGRQVHRPAVARRHLLGGQPPAQAVPDGPQPRRRGRLVGVDPAPGRDEHRVRAQLRGAGLVEDVRAALTARRAVAAAAVAAARPRRQSRAGRRQVDRAVHALAAPGRGRRDEPVRRHLGAHRRRRPAQLPGDLPARGPALQHPLDRVPLVPGEPAVGPRDRLLGTLLPLSGHTVLRSPGAGQSGPQGTGFPHSSVHVRMNVGSVRMKLIIKDLLGKTLSVSLFSLNL